MFFKALRNLFGLLYAIFFRMNWRGYFKYRDKKSDNIIWLCPVYPSRLLEYLLRATFINDLALIDTFIRNRVPFRVVWGRKIGRHLNKKIFYTVSYHFNLYHLVNYSRDIVFILKALEEQGNQLFPNWQEIEYWENKAFMQEKFVELDISHPRTRIVKPGEISTLDTASLEYPLLWKDVHSSGSKGLYKIADEQALKDKIKEKTAAGLTTFLLQQLIDMRRDLRVTLVNDKIVHHYWRISHAEEWKPTATSFGSSVDFETFPEQWRTYIIDSFKKMKLTTGAYDITWDKDDLNTMPLMLEISPSYDLNPPQPEKYSKMSYGAYKKKLFIRDAYYKKRVDIFFEIKRMVVETYLRQLGLIK